MSKIWIQTYTGKAFDLLEPTVDMVDPYDIAVSLADKPRYSAHTRTRITVGQHSILCAAAVYRKAIAEGLGEVEAVRRAQLLALHDAAEAMIGDVLGPARMAIKALCYELVERLVPPANIAALPRDAFDLFAKLDERVSRVIYKAFGVGVDFDALSNEDHLLILRVDRAELLFEKTWFVQTPEPRPWGVTGTPLDLAAFGAGAESPATLARAVLITEPWDVETTVAAFMRMCMRLGLIPSGWAQSEHVAYFSGYTRGDEIVQQLFSAV